MFVRRCVCLSGGLYVCLDVCMFVQEVYMFASGVCLSGCVYVCEEVCMFVRMCVRLSGGVYVCQVCMFASMYVLLCVTV